MPIPQPKLPLLPNRRGLRPRNRKPVLRRRAAQSKGPRPKPVMLPIGSTEWLEQEQAATIEELQDSTLCRPIVAFRNPRLTLRIRKRWTSYCGGMAWTAAYFQAIPIAAVLGVLPAIIMLRTDEVPDALALFYGVFIMVIIGNQVMVQKGFSEGMMEIHVNKRGLFYRPEVVPEHYMTYVPKILMAHRASDWRGRNGRAGFRSPNPIMWLMCPPEMDIKDAANLSTLMSLPNDPYVSDDTALYAHRAWSRHLQSNAFDKHELDNPRDEKLSDKWPYIAAMCIVAAGVIMVIVVTGSQT